MIISQNIFQIIISLENWEKKRKKKKRKKEISSVGGGTQYNYMNVNIKSEMISFKSNENIHKKEDGSYYVVSANKPHQWPCNHPATKARGNILQFCEFQIGNRFKDWYKSKWPCNHPATKARGNILQFCEFQIGSRFKDWYKSKWGPNK